MIEGLLARGHRVWMLHSGAHKPLQNTPGTFSKEQPWYSDGRVKLLFCNAFRANEFLECLDTHHDPAAVDRDDAPAGT